MVDQQETLTSELRSRFLEAQQEVEERRLELRKKYPDLCEENRSVPPKDEEGRLRYIGIPEKHWGDDDLFFSLVTGKLVRVPRRVGSEYAFNDPDFTNKRDATPEEYIENYHRVLAELDMIQVRAEEAKADLVE